MLLLAIRDIHRHAEYCSRTRIYQVPSRPTFGKQPDQDDPIDAQDCYISSPPDLYACA